jgi:hypothetical protein
MKKSDFPKWQRVAVPAVVIFLALFYFSKYYVAGELVSANHRIEALERDLDDARDKLSGEQARATVAEREVDVVRRANALLRDSERDRQDEIASLQAELAFYRRLGGANGSQAPLAVHHLELQTTQSPRVYRMIITLTQNLRWAAVISGHVRLSVDGIENGKARQLHGDQLLAESTDPLEFKFKYFQQLERLITLPDGFVPDRLTIELKSGSLSSTVEQSMPWQSLFNDSEAGAPSSDDRERVEQASGGD